VDERFDPRAQFDVYAGATKGTPVANVMSLGDRSSLSAADPERLAGGLRFLSSASRALAASFDYVATLRAVADLTVPAYASGLTVEIDDQGTPSIACSAGVGVGARVTKFPLVARERAVGALRITMAGQLDALDHEIFEELALRIAVAIDSAQIYAREHHVADTLQRALLPERLPEHDRVRFDAAYIPATEEAIVGGDWYDAFNLPDGRIAISIGDVAGHGLRAAIVMGEVRQAFRAAALNPTSPSDVLERANTIVNMRPNPIMVTAIFGIIDPATATITYAAAGHPAPVLALPCLMVERLPSGGIPLGIADRIDATDWSFTIPPGAYLAMYTDGLIEHSHDVIAGEEQLLDAMRDEIVERSASPALSLMNRVFGDRKNNDDCAALFVATSDEPRTAFSFDFSAIPMAVPIVRRTLQRFLRALELDDDRVYAMITAVGEATANAVEHAYVQCPGIVRLRVTHSDGALRVTVEDDGRWKQAQKRDERGRGLPLMRALMDGVEIRTNQSHTAIHLTLAWSPGDAEASL
jgi:serine phosphatase RsbU (regulator of sigma subunit)/anti-sigma regulatory factor (Ser/Thr protein kinase)